MIENKNWNIEFTNSRFYKKHFNCGLGSYIESFGGIKLEILNNLPTIAYNYEYKVHEPISLITYLYNPELSYQAIDIVLQQITLRSGRPKGEMGEDEVIIFTKEQLVKEILTRKHNILNIVSPDGKDNFQELNYYLNKVIRRYLYRESRKMIYNFFKMILGKNENI